MRSLHDIAILEEQRQAVGSAECGLECEPIAGGWMTFAGVGNWCNQACGLGLSGPVSAEDVDRLVAFYATRRVEPCVEVCPYADVAFPVELSKRGFQIREFENVFYRELAQGEDLHSKHPHQWPNDVTIIQVDPSNEDQVHRFANISTLGFRKEGEAMTDDMLTLITTTARHARSRCFMAEIEGEPVGGGSMELGTEIACLFGTSVDPAHRRKGIQAALILQRLLYAREFGCTLATIHSKPGSSTERNALRLGFSLAYTKAILTMPGPGLVPSP